MDAKAFLKEIRRMCKSISCCDCPFNEGQWYCKVSYHAEAFANAVNAVEQWSSEHPEKTRLQDFLEKYPEAPVDSGVPVIDPVHVGYCRGRKDCNGCECNKHGIEYCWNMSVEE